MKQREIKCNCNDPSCEIEGDEGEISGHIEDCPCGLCHREMGKISPHLKITKKL